MHTLWKLCIWRVHVNDDFEGNSHSLPGWIHLRNALFGERSEWIDNTNIIISLMNVRNLTLKISSESATFGKKAIENMSALSLSGAKLGRFRDECTILVDFNAHEFFRNFSHLATDRILLNSLEVVSLAATLTTIEQKLQTRLDMQIKFEFCQISSSYPPTCKDEPHHSSLLKQVPQDTSPK